MIDSILMMPTEELISLLLILAITLAAIVFILYDAAPSSQNDPSSQEQANDSIF